ncbi:MAG: cellulase family glycosylhydrolase, partial [Planctomycetota bacterium]
NDSPELWNDYLDQALTVIRTSNPNRPVLVGPVFWNSISALSSFDPPEDPNLVTTVHYYDPFEFTHQGATWVNPVPPVGTRWVAREYRFVNEWQNYSWGTTVDQAVGGMKVTFDQGFAGYYFHSDEGVEDVTHLVFTADRAMNLQVKVTGPDGEGPGVQIATTNGNNTYQIPMSQLGNPSLVTEVWLQNASPNAQATWTNTKLLLKTSTGKHFMIGSQRDDIELAMDKAVAWTNERGMALYLGEFGAYELANYADRVRWTRAVREIAEQRNIDWAYWELAAGFGIYDPDTNAFRRQLLKALNPDFSR